MKCADCEREGKRSKVYIGAQSRTLLMGARYYDEDGRYHQRDVNKTTTRYECSNGHKWAQTR